MRFAEEPEVKYVERYMFPKLNAFKRFLKTKHHLPFHGLADMALSDEEFLITTQITNQIWDLSRIWFLKPRRKEEKESIFRCFIVLPTLEAIAPDVDFVARDVWDCLCKVHEDRAIAPFLQPLKRTLHLKDLESHNHFFKLALLYMFLCTYDKWGLTLVS